MSAADVIPSPRENWRRRTTLGKALFPAWAFAWCFWYVVVSLVLGLVDRLHVDVYHDELDDRGQMAAFKDPLLPLALLALVAAASALAQVVVGLL